MTKLTRRDFIKAVIMGVAGVVGALFLPKQSQSMFDELVGGLRNQTPYLDNVGLTGELIQGVKGQKYSLVYPGAASDGGSLWIDYGDGSAPFLLSCHTLDDDVV